MREVKIGSALTNQEPHDAILWKPPKERSYYVNFDATIKKNIGTGLGMIIHNYKGQVIAIVTKFMDIQLSPRF